MSTGAAGGKADDDAHRPRRIGLRPRSARHGRQRGSTRCQMQKVSAGKFYGIPPYPGMGRGGRRPSEARGGARPAHPRDGYCTNGPNGARWMISMRVPQGSVM